METISDIEIRESSPTWSRWLAALVAILITALVLAGFLLLRKRQGALYVVPTASSTSGPVKPPRLLIIAVDDAMVSGASATLGGTVTNSSDQRLEGVTVHVELSRRKGDAFEVRDIALTPADLGPNEVGNYSVVISTDEFKGARVRSVSLADKREVGFSTIAGAKRPTERDPTEMESGAKQPGKSEGVFLNSPDHPVVVH